MTPAYLTSAALRRALARVRENHGCAGADGVPITAFDDAALDALRESVEDESYCPWPLRRIEVEKHPDSTERRTLLVPAVRDRTLQTAVATHIEPFLEAEFDSCSFAYRRGRSVRMAVERVYQLQREGYVWILDADIDDFFSTVNRELIIGRLSTLIQDELVIRLVRLWLEYAVWDGLHLTRPDCGLPQGAVISPMLANLCLDTLDDRLLEAGIQVVRYADDFVILSKSHKAAERAQALAESTLAELRLRLDSEKTRLVRASDGFRFLGVIFLKDMLLQPWKPGRKGLKVLSVAGPLPEHFFPQAEQRTLRHVRVF